jgi:hypothetical protein
MIAAQFIVGRTSTPGEENVSATSASDHPNPRKNIAIDKAE